MVGWWVDKTVNIVFCLGPNLEHFHEEFHVPHAKTERMAKSAIPYMARLMNTNIK